jgi:hypothetical protein
MLESSFLHERSIEYEYVILKLHMESHMAVCIELINYSLIQNITFAR